MEFKHSTSQLHSRGNRVAFCFTLNKYVVPWVYNIIFYRLLCNSGGLRHCKEITGEGRQSVNENGRGKKITFVIIGSRYP